MADSLRERILDALMAALVAAPTGATIFRARETSITRAVSPALVVMPQAEEVERRAAAGDLRTLTVGFEIFVRGDPWDEFADPVAVAAHPVIMGVQASLPFIVSIVPAGSEWQAEEADRTAGALTMRYLIKYWNAAGDLAAAPTS